MDKQQLIAGIKKNFLSILCGVVALISLGFMLFWINPRISSVTPNADSVKQRVAARAAKAEEINRLLSQQRRGIVVTPGVADTNLPPGVFPTPRLIASGRTTMEGVKAQANEVLENALELNRRIPLGWSSYEAADADWPLDGEAKATHRDRYRTEYARWLNADNSQFDPESGNHAEGTLQAAMGATRPPTPAEMQGMEGGLEARLKTQVPLDEKGNPTNAEEFQRLLGEGRIALAAGLKYRRAQQHRIYVDANGQPGSASNGFSIHPFIAAKELTGVDCFNAQVGLWVQETVAQNLMRANEQAIAVLPSDQQNVLGAPVKHLVLIAVPNVPFGEAKKIVAVTDTGEPVAPPQDRSAIRGGGGKAPAPTGAPEKPTEETPTETAAPAGPASIDPTAFIERRYNLSPSGRVLNTPFYDLVQFRVVLRCDSAAAPYVLEQLQASSFITVLNVDLAVVDPAVAAQQGYVYGPRPVVQLSLQCEMPFLRQWMMPLMPMELQQGIADREAAAAQAASGY